MGIMQLNLTKCEILMTMGGSPIAFLEDSDGNIGYYILEQSVDSIANGTIGTLYHWSIPIGKSVGMGRKASVVDPEYGAQQIIDLINAEFIKLYGDELAS